MFRKNMLGLISGGMMMIGSCHAAETFHLNRSESAALVEAGFIESMKEGKPTPTFRILLRNANLWSALREASPVTSKTNGQKQFCSALNQIFSGNKVKVTAESVELIVQAAEEGSEDADNIIFESFGKKISQVEPSEIEGLKSMIKGRMENAMCIEEEKSPSNKTVFEPLKFFDFSEYKDCLEESINLILDIFKGSVKENVFPSDNQKYFLKNISNLLPFNPQLTESLTNLTTGLSLKNIDSYTETVDQLTTTLSPHEYEVLFDEDHLKNFYFTLRVYSFLEQIESGLHTDIPVVRIVRQLRGTVNYAESVCDDNPTLVENFKDIYQQFKEFEED